MRWVEAALAGHAAINGAAADVCTSARACRGVGLNSRREPIRASPEQTIWQAMLMAGAHPCGMPDVVEASRTRSGPRRWLGRVQAC